MLDRNSGKVYNVPYSPKASPGFIQKMARVVNSKFHSGFDDKKFCQKHGIVRDKK